MSAAVERPPSLGPRRVGDVRVGASLGHGGFGHVYRGWSRTHGEVAVKLFHETGTSAHRACAHEAAVLAAAKGPHAPRVLDHGTHAGTPFLVMSLVAGASLPMCHGFCTPLPAALVLELLLQVCEPLARLHRGGWVHGDVKPPNVMLDDAGTITLVDFGAAVARDRAPLARPPGARGPLVGTPHYAAPELHADRCAIDPAADVYSLGMIAYELLAARIPFAPTVPFVAAFRAWSGDEARWRHAHHHAQPAPLADTPAGTTIPAALAGLVADCLAKPAARRPRDASVLAARARAIYDEPS